MHSARNLKLNGTEPNFAPSLDMKARFSRVVLVNIDENLNYQSSSPRKY